MSMAFAAALAGGVALESEQIDRSDQTSQAVKNLRGNLRLFSAVGLEGARERAEGSTAATESRLVRRHSEASIFIDLHAELKRTRQLLEEPSFDEIKARDIVSMQLGPAVAPLRRVLDQVIRLLNLTMPVLGAEEDSSETRQRGKRRSAPPKARQDEGLAELRQIHQLFVAMRDDLEHSGMIDIAVTRDDAPSAVITLDKRFVSPHTIELLHTSEFTIIGKVTNIWRGPDDVANLYRRSVVSLLPSLAQTVTWGLLALLAGLARGLDPKPMERMAYEAAGLTPANGESEEVRPTELRPTVGTGQSDDDGPLSLDQGETGASGDDEGEEEEILFGEDLVAALNPIVSGPAFQILPLAICS